MIKYIYKITNKINGRCYIGQTNNPKRRFQEHKNMGYTDGTGKLLYYAFNKYGIENFTFEVIDSGENYDELEKYYIEKFNSFADGYNCTIGGENPPIGSHTIYTDDEINEVIELLMNTELTFKEISNITNIPDGYINHINTGNSRKRDDLVYPLRNKAPFLSEEIILEIIELLLGRDYTQKEIAKMYNVARSTITNINNGNYQYKREGYTYPLRNKRVVK